MNRMTAVWHETKVNPAIDSEAKLLNDYPTDLIPAGNIQQH
jgi:hypothetical protein